MDSTQEISEVDKAFASAIDNRAFGDAALLLEQGANIDRLLPISETVDRDVYEDTITYLGYAALLVRADTAAFLLSHGANPNIKGVLSGRTALMAATRSDHAELVQLLLEHGADVNALDTYDNTRAIDYAISQQNAEMTRMLIAAGARGTFQRLKFNGPKAADDLEIAGMLLAQGADIEERDNWGRTVLMWAVERASLEMIQFLIASGADANAISTEGSNRVSNHETALQLARRNKRPAVVAFLLQQGAIPRLARYDRPHSLSSRIKKLFGW